MPQSVFWDTTPLSAVTSASTTTVTFRLRNATRRDQGLKLPHTFNVGNGIAVTNRVPTEVMATQGGIQGSWKVSRMRWKMTPQNVQRQDYDNLVVTFEPDEGGVMGYSRSTDALIDVPHSFTVEGTTVSDQKPAKVLAVRGGRVCPCYGLWLVSKPLTEPQWGKLPVGLPWRRSSDRNWVVSEYQFFFPLKGVNQDWETVARTTVHSFAVAGIPVSRAPDEAYTVKSGRVLGRWLVHVPMLEGFEMEGPSSHPSMQWLVFVLLIGLLIVIIVRLLQKK